MLMFEYITCGVTDKGLVREMNQDNFFIDQLNNVFMIADGMGGHAAGELASALAIEIIHETLQKEDNSEMTISNAPETSDGLMLGRLRFAINQASQIIRQEASRQPECMGMGTTIAVMAFVSDTVCVAHAGDTRAYLVRPGKIIRLTKDHTWVSDQVYAGLLTETQAANSNFRNVLTRSVGLEIYVNVDTSCYYVQHGDKYLLCSDGLHGVVSDLEIYEYLTKYDAKTAVDKLLSLTLSRGAPDNVTLIIVETLKKKPNN